jgi:hypothetical protein
MVTYPIDGLADRLESSRALGVQKHAQGAGHGDSGPKGDAAGRKVV